MCSILCFTSSYISCCVSAYYCYTSRSFLMDYTIVSTTVCIFF